MMDEQQWKLQADKSLEQLYKALAEASDRHAFETDFGGSLTVEFDDPPAKFVISPNSPVQQIWVSAHSKSYKLPFEVSRNEFVLPDTGQTLQELIQEAVSRQLGEQVEL